MVANYARIYNAAIDRLNPWQNVNMTLTFADSRTWTAQLFVKNLFDKQPIVLVLIQFRQNTRGGSAMHFQSIVELSDAIRRRTVSPVEVTQHMLKRIEATDAAYGAYVTVVAERALGQAKAAEAAILRGGWRGPLHGVPVALKDIITPGTGQDRI